MDWSTVLVIVGVAVALGGALLAFGVLDALGYGPDGDASSHD